MQYGGFWRRFAAIFIDSIIYFVVAYSLPQDNPNVQIMLFVVFTAYFVWMNGMYGATVGKMVMKLKITKENGAKISYSDALVREITSYLSFVVLFLGYLNVIWDKKKQGWHDKIAKTLVVKT